MFINVYHITFFIVTVNQFDSTCRIFSDLKVADYETIINKSFNSCGYIITHLEEKN